jgi:peptidoglycan/xylan/chitin deacetylase (PgdA/CDA1 family)
MKRIALIAIVICLFSPAAGINARAQNGISGQAASREVAVTFDDLPAVTLGGPAAFKKITTGLLRSITSNRVPVIGFVNENKLTRGGGLANDRVALLRMWLDRGLELGNHTFSHPDLHNTPLAAFEENVIRGEEATRRLLEAKGKRLRYFRHPFLHTGRDLETKRKFEEFLASRGYRVAPVTIDNSEWIFARAYENAPDKRVMKQVGAEYISYMDRKFDYFEKQSVGLFGREIKQVLLLHANALNADYFDELARMMRKRGYKFITIDEALKDEAYRSEDTYTGAGGITWLHRWAITRGVDKGFFKGEPATPGYILKLAGVASE